MKSAEFQKLVTKHFAPRIRESGWTGSGYHFRKTEKNHIIKVFGFQVNPFGYSVCCETAVHFDFIPGDMDLSKITYTGCMIRDRLSPAGTVDYWWELGTTESHDIKIINQIWETFIKNGQEFYRQFDQFPHPFDKIRVKDLEKKNYKLLDKYAIFSSIDFAWLLMEINSFIGRKEIAGEFSLFGINTVKEWAMERAKRYNEKIDEDYIGYYEKKFRITS